jgi:CubicO group peptidase (beta-lactamase class C family)
VYSRGYGYANLDDSVPITPQTVFDVASVTKQFVAASLSMLALQGKLSFDDDVRKYLPELPRYTHTITLRHMVYHTSGLRNYLSLFPLAGRDEYYPISHRQILAMMARQRALNFVPGTEYEYSNTAYMLLAQVIQRISGHSLGEFLQQRIFAPVGMHASLAYDNFERIIPRRAIGYARARDSVRMTHNFNFDVPGDGQMYTTVEDLIRWDDYLHGPDKPEFHDIIMREGTLNDGTKIQRAKGLFLSDYRGARTIHHTGSSWGFRTVLERFVDAELGIAIACNDDNAFPRRIALQIADYMLADELAAPAATDATTVSGPAADERRVRPALTAAQRQEFAGDFYAAELDAIYRIEARADGLFLSIEQEPPVAVLPVGADQLAFEFQPQGWAESETVVLAFERRPDGQVSRFLLGASTARGIVFEKVELPGD